MKRRGFEIISEYRDKNIVLPTRQTAKSAGYDIAAAVDTELLPGRVTAVPTGVKAYMQDDEYLGLHIRSSMALKRQITLANAQGVIDADYYDNPGNEGHILVALVNNGAEPVTIKKGERIAQGIFYKYLTADDDAAAQNERGGGFGSTGV